MQKLKYLLFIPLIFAININASTYSEWEHVEVNKLPTASSNTVNKIYDYDNKYYVTDVQVFESEKYEVGDTFTELYFIYPNIKNIIKDFLRDNNCYGSDCKFFQLNDSKYLYIMRYSSDSFSPFIFLGSTSYSLFSSCSASNPCYFDDNTIYFKNPSDTIYTITSIPDNIFSQNAYKSIGQTKYTWKEISYYDWFELKEVESTDYYLFYTFTEISNFDVFSWVDFSYFNDFHKIVVVLMVNGFYLGFIGLCIYILLKGLNKLISWLF